MANLPSKPSASTHSLPERADHREWIGGRVLTLLSHYWRDDDPVELTAAIGGDWADVLEGIPQEYIQRACIQYQRDEPRRKPTPGAIYQIARGYMPKPVAVDERRPETREEREARLQEKQERPVFDEARAAKADRILKQAGVKLNANGGVEKL